MLLGFCFCAASLLLELSSSSSSSWSSCSGSFASLSDEDGPLMFARRISLRMSDRLLTCCLYVSARLAARECRWARSKMFSVCCFRWVRFFVTSVSAVIRAVVMGRLGA